VLSGATGGSEVEAGMNSSNSSERRSFGSVEASCIRSKRPQASGCEANPIDCAWFALGALLNDDVGRSYGG
jgi:hypothetical protein